MRATLLEIIISGNDNYAGWHEIEIFNEPSFAEFHATAATHLYQAGVDEQIIMETMGHKNTSGVCSYKYTKTQQK